MEDLWPRGLVAVYPVTAGVAPPSDFPPTAGRFEWAGGALRFTPRHPFRPGQEYELRARLDPPLVLRITRPAIAGEPTTTVLAITPTAADLPRNHLRFYVHFSAAMAEGHAAGSVTLRAAADGEPLAGAVLAMEPELWDAGRTRLTVLLEPGRIKRGLAPQLDAGYPLVEGQDVVLEVAASFVDAAGRPLRNSASCRYRVGPDVRERVDPSRWLLTPPAAQTKQPLTVRFDRSLDSALALRCVTVVDERGQPVLGHVALTEGEREWAFTPNEPWAVGS